MVKSLFRVKATASAGCIASVLSLLAIAPAHAQSVVNLNLYSTGQSSVFSAGTQTQYANGTADPHWAIVSGPSGAETVLTTTPNSGWIADTTTSKWVSDVADSNSGVSAAGNFDFQTLFTIPAGYNPATTSITFAFTSDNATNSVSVNGTATGITGSGSFNTFSSAQTLNASNSTFHTGSNTIDFVVNNATATANPMGLNVVFQTGSVSSAPEPTSIVMAFVGLTACGAGIRRRSS